MQVHISKINLKHGAIRCISNFTILNYQIPPIMYQQIKRY